MDDIIVNTRKFLEVEIDERLVNTLKVNDKPLDINERNIHSYTEYSRDGLILKKYVRETTSSDTLAQYDHSGVSVLPQFFGEWRELSEKEIEALNKEIIEKNNKRRHYKVGVTIDESKVDVSITDPDARNKLALQKAYELLQKKLKEKEVIKDAGADEFDE